VDHLTTWLGWTSPAKNQKTHIRKISLKSVVDHFPRFSSTFLAFPFLGAHRLELRLNPESARGGIFPDSQTPFFFPGRQVVTTELTLEKGTQSGGFFCWSGSRAFRTARQTHPLSKWKQNRGPPNSSTKSAPSLPPFPLFFCVCFFSFIFPLHRHKTQTTIVKYRCWMRRACANKTEPTWWVMLDDVGRRMMDGGHGKGTHRPPPPAEKTPHFPALTIVCLCARVAA